MPKKKQLENNYQSNPLLKKVGVDVQFTEENVNEFIKCKKDVTYFANNYVKIVTLDKGLTNINLYKYQENLLKTFDKNRFVCVKYPRQSGKCVMGDTAITIKNKETGETKNIQIEKFFVEKT